MAKVVNIEDKNARMLITKLLSYDDKMREGLDMFYNSNYLSLQGHSLGQDVHFDRQNQNVDQSNYDSNYLNSNTGLKNEIKENDNYQSKHSEIKDDLSSSEQKKENLRNRNKMKRINHKHV